MQNAALSLVTLFVCSITPSRTYSSTSPILSNKILKELIPFSVPTIQVFNSKEFLYRGSFSSSTPHVYHKISHWKLSISATLHVTQNSLQSVAVSDLPLLLCKTFSPTNRMALRFLALGVGIVQILRVSRPGSQVYISRCSSRVPWPTFRLGTSNLHRFSSFLHCCLYSPLTSDTPKVSSEICRGNLMVIK